MAEKRSGKFSWKSGDVTLIPPKNTKKSTPKSNKGSKKK